MLRMGVGSKMPRSVFEWGIFILVVGVPWVLFGVFVGVSI